MGHQELADRAAHDATAKRMRRGEPAPTEERARVEADLARRALLMWWEPWAFLCFAVLCMPLLLSQDGVVGRALALFAVLGNVGIAVWRKLHLLGAARLLDANQRRWGNL